MMDTYQYDLVKRLSFLRFGGTDAELDAAHILLEEIAGCGGKGALEEFTIPAAQICQCAVKVVSPYEKTLEVSPWRMSGSLPEGGVDLKLFYAADCSEAVFYRVEELSDCVVLVDEMKIDHYKTLCEKKAAAILVITGKWHHSKETSDFLERSLRPPFLHFGKIPTFFIRAKDAAEMVEQGAEMLHIELIQREYEAISRNVVATVVGTQIPEESAVVTAHYDSVSVGTGSWDNATGTATAMYLYRYFVQHPPKRTMRFLFCGSEEQGLCGSRAYVAAHPELVEKEIRFGFNFDMCGTILGANSICVTGGEELKNYAEAFCKEYGINASAYADIRSSDSAPFSDKGIPTADLIRYTKTAEIHTRYDLIDTISAKQLRADGDFAIAFIERTLNAARLPVGRGMPDDIRDKLDKYFYRDKLPKEKA